MNVALIPVRGGSKSIHLKNIKEIYGHPLVYWSMKAAVECEQIDKVYVSTDSEKIRDIVNSIILEEGYEHKAIVIGRSSEVSTDTASTESVMLEFASKNEFDNIVLIQATSPLITSKDISKGFETLFKTNIDSVLSVVRQKRFCWREEDDGRALPINYDDYNRPRRQEFDGYLVENGAFYITPRDLLISSGNRVSGNIGLVEMPEDSYYEIDEQVDWIIIEKLLEERIKKGGAKL